MRRPLLLCLVPCLLGCVAEPAKDEVIEPISPETGDTISLLGERLVPPEISDKTRADFESKLAVAQADFDAAPNNVEATIWLGRRLAYLGRYSEAIEVFSRGIDEHPEEARLYRHRGHRFITTRQLDRAIADLERAAGLIEGLPDAVEPDGLPNAAGIPTSTLQSNIWYHLGLARYLQGDFERALRAYEECLEVSKNPDMLVATSHWLYMTLRRLSRDSEAAAVLDPISADLEVIENHEYHQLLLMYSGEIPPEDLWPSPDDSISSAALGYGIGNWHLYNGRPTEAEDVFDQILEGEQWAAFGFLAAEAEIAREQGKALR